MSAPFRGAGYSQCLLLAAHTMETTMHPRQIVLLDSRARLPVPGKSAFTVTRPALIQAATDPPSIGAFHRQPNAAVAGSPRPPNVPVTTLSIFTRSDRTSRNATAYSLAYDSRATSPRCYKAGQGPDRALPAFLDRLACVTRTALGLPRHRWSARRPAFAPNKYVLQKLHFYSALPPLGSLGTPLPTRTS